MIQSFFRSVRNFLIPSEQSRKRRRTEDEEKLGLPPYNYQTRQKLDDLNTDPVFESNAMQPYNAQPSTSRGAFPRPSTSKDTSGKPSFNFKGTVKSGIVKGKAEDDDIQILQNCSSKPSCYQTDRTPLATKPNAFNPKAVNEVRKPRQTIAAPSLAGSSGMCMMPYIPKTSAWVYREAPKSALPHRHPYKGQPMSTSTPKRSESLMHLRIESKAITRRKGVIFSSYNLEEKKRYRELIASNTQMGSLPSKCAPFMNPPPLIDLTLNDDEISKDLVVAPKPLSRHFPSTNTTAVAIFKKPEIVKNDDEVVYVQSIKRKNSLLEELQLNNVYSGKFIQEVQNDFSERSRLRQKEIQQTYVRTQLTEEKSKNVYDDNFVSHIKKSLVLFDLEKEEEVIPEIEEEGLPELNDEALDIVNKALYPRPPNEVLVSGFNTDILRKDINTLADRNWLNDEVINFYMELIRERGSLDNYPRVHTFNTFFFPKLRQSGFQLLKRWTKKVDIFSQDLIIVPIHLGVHWCMSVLDMSNKTAYYFDSMLAPNPSVLSLLMKYLEDESQDKKKVPYDTKSWKLVQEKEIPQQHNGYDCGVFACMFAETASRRGKFIFTQEDMPDLRRRMVFEILTKKLLT